MKQLIVIFLALGMLMSAPLASFGQVVEEYDDVDEAIGVGDYQKKGFNTNRLFVGGILGLGFSSNVANVEVSPQVGYRILDFVQVGINATYIFQSQRDPFGGPTANIHIFGGGPFTRILAINFDAIGNRGERDFNSPSSGIYVLGEFQRLKATINDDFVLAFDSENVFNIGAGYANNFGRGFGYYFEIAYNVLYEDNMSFSPWPWTPRAAIYFGF
ncbi:MAG: hypothetical protein AAFV80_16910 [Bacteroidota bacterium]